LYESQREWTNTAKLWLDLNHLPAFKGVDHGIERRPRVIPFERRFEEHEQDKRLVDKIDAELPGVLAWAVEGCREWRRRGLDPPEAVRLATRQYVEDNNHLPTFIRDTYTVDPSGRVLVADLRREYTRFCEQRGEPQLDYAKKVVPFLRMRLKEHRTNKARSWQGIVRLPDIQ
jgi:putative DNA primase/helicase